MPRRPCRYSLPEDDAVVDAKPRGAAGGGRLFDLCGVAGCVGAAREEEPGGVVLREGVRGGRGCIGEAASGGVFAGGVSSGGDVAQAVILLLASSPGRIGGLLHY